MIKNIKYGNRGSVSTVIIICLTVLILAFGGMFFYEKNMAVPKQNSAQYEGAWYITAIPTNTDQCASAQANVSISNGLMSGNLITTDNVSAVVSAAVSSEGVITPGVTTNSAMFSGKIADASSGNGTWIDSYGCSGTFVMSRLPQQKDEVSVKKVPTPTATSPVVTTKQRVVNTKTVSVPVVKTSVTPSGSWSGRAVNNTSGICQNYTIAGSVSNGLLSGTYKGESLGDVGYFGARVSNTGVISPGRAGDEVSFNGQITGNTASGQWKYVGDPDVHCGGSFTLQKK
jgi:hypothetical protein